MGRIPVEKGRKRGLSPKLLETLYDDIDFDSELGRSVFLRRVDRLLLEGRLSPSEHRALVDSAKEQRAMLEAKRGEERARKALAAAEEIKAARALQSGAVNAGPPPDGFVPGSNKTH